MDLRSLVSYYQEKEARPAAAPDAQEAGSSEQSYPVDYAAAAAYYQNPLPAAYYAYYYGQPQFPTGESQAGEGHGGIDTAVATEEGTTAEVVHVEVQDDAEGGEEAPRGKKRTQDEGEDEGSAEDDEQQRKKKLKQRREGEDGEQEKEKEEEESSSSESESDEDEDGAKKKKKEEAEHEEYSEFHGESLYDYQGRTYLSPPSHLRVGVPHECFMPKKMLHQWRLGAGRKSKSKKKKLKELRRKRQREAQQQNKLGFSVETVVSKPKNQDPTNGVNAIRLFPRSGHVVISANRDGTVKLFDLYNERRCLRTFYGHRRGVRDIMFNYDGTQFLSSSFDRTIKLWDTETGACVQRFSNRKLAYCVKFPPSPSGQHNFLAGCSDNRVYQWDIRTGNVVQEYNYHLGPVNAIEFVDEGRRFMSSSDDKSLRVWEYGIPVEIKEIREPYLHSMPVLAPHPTDPWIIAQSMDNQILVISTKDKFKMNKKKRFQGHLVAGYACQLGFSPDGHYVISGDGAGNLWIWDWKTHRILKKLECHNRVLIGCEWHPVEPSRVVTCSWDGTIKYWD